jgi:transcriptional regulator with XRE-family HTH domain
MPGVAISPGLCPRRMLIRRATPVFGVFQVVLSVRSQDAFDLVEHLQDKASQMESDRLVRLRDERIGRELARNSVTLGAAIHQERRRRHLSLRDLARAAGVGLGTAQAAEAGVVCTLETYVRLADALRLKACFALEDPRRREPATRPVDPVHAAMGEAEAAHLRARGFNVGMDEPFQHYQFSGRADVVAWSVESRALLHIENKTQIPDLQSCFGSFNAKRAYLGAEFAARCGVSRWSSETHVMAGLWSAEVLHTIRIHKASFASVCPDPPATFDAWWREGSPEIGRHSTLVVFDPIEHLRTGCRRWLGAEELDGVRPRHRDYADAVARLGLGV